MDRLKERLSLAERALRSLNQLVVLPSPTDIERDASIQRFEYSFEALWKAIKRYLEVVEGIQANSPKAAIRSSLDVGLLDEKNTRRALLMADDRNLTSHTYNEELAKEIAGRIPQHAAVMVDWLTACKQRID